MVRPASWQQHLCLLLESKVRSWGQSNRLFVSKNPSSSMHTGACANVHVYTHTETHTHSH